MANINQHLTVYIGWDPRDDKAFRVCKESLLDHASIPITVKGLYEWELRADGLYRREYLTDENGQLWDMCDGRPFSTQFSFSRFLVPKLENYQARPSVFCDPDMLWRADIAELVELYREGPSLWCVKHEYAPEEAVKKIGYSVIQTRYRRKNWSSLMMINAAENKDLTPARVNAARGTWLHGMQWLPDHKIEALPEAWNWLENWSAPDIDPKVVHYTSGTPDMQSRLTPYDKEWFKRADAA